MGSEQRVFSRQRVKTTDIFGILMLLGAAALIVGINFLVHISQGDDAVNIVLMKGHGWINWVNMRYMTWSGRISSEAVGYIGLHLGNWFYWLTNPFFIFLAGYSCARIVTPKPSARQIAFVLMVFGIMNVKTQTSTMFWISGSYGYIMPAAFGFYAMITFADCFFRNQNRIKPVRFVLTALSAIMATLGNETVSLVVTTFVLLCVGYKFVKKERISAYFWILAVIFVTTTVILFRAPGSALRWQTELRWFPGFDKLTLGAHAKISMTFLFDTIVNQQALLLLIVASIPFFYHNRYTGIYKVLLYFYAVLYSAFISTKLITGTYREMCDFSYYRNNYYAAISLHHLVQYIFWSLFFICLILLVSRVSEHPWFETLCFLAAGASLIVITFSPTIYASGSRVLFVCSLMFILIAAHFAIPSPLLKNNLFLCGFAVLSLFNVFSYMLLWIVKGYSPIL